ncbi:M17 family metallopeptidase [Photobacterium aquimaris]|uniref:Leucyl aminopeptidase family protein n=1 Tax=Photobacterium aquimaris TaxID=512643 RepID=A0A2T3HWG2_9GAMM|nr:leucyl aminopeptidase family protein [Photobacterium aquimaris]MCP4955109.1 leucyl aminopeptidase family protein [Photobacterium aquimaris]OBU20765.1 leucyl aminopeptidase [Photobacterium aquimaris]PQJ38248.1 leucyl aminopeptidase [Photobacterium aquimaris]PSU03256.1 leucyl aminopeptidase family protein [Photobacterium aquimaris]
MNSSLLTLTFARTQQCDQLTRTIYLTSRNNKQLTLNQDVSNFNAEISKAAFTVADIQDIGYLIATTFTQATTLQLCIDDTVANQYSHQQWLKWLSFGLALSTYRYHHSNSPILAPTMANFTLLNATIDDNSAFENGRILAQSQLIARELINKPGNVIYPQSFVEAVEALAINNIELSYLDDAMMLEQGFGGLMSIAQGSDREARLLCLDYHPQNPQLTVALVGKGVTFDSGGISIKQPRYMSTMKVDMGGAAAVVGALNAIAQLQLPIRVIGLCGLVENMPSGTAIKPGDVVTMLNKTSVEIISTDAEGRMVLADVLHYAQQHYQPDYLIDIATLTGGTGIALGKAFASLMGNNDDLIAHAKAAGQACSEPLWPMPSGDMFSTALDSDFADLRHGSEEPDGSPCVAATFLSHFIEPNQKWIHIDSAAMSFMTHRKIYAKATTGYGTLLLTELCQQLILQDQLHK